MRSFHAEASEHKHQRPRHCWHGRGRRRLAPNVERQRVSRGTGALRPSIGTLGHAEAAEGRVSESYGAR